MKTIRKSVSLLFALLMLLAVIPAAFADEKFGDYQIYSTSYEDIKMYSVYTPEQLRKYSTNVLHHAIAPTFVTDATDVYSNMYSGNDIRITFYRSMEILSSDQAQVFSEYLLTKTHARHAYSGWFSLTHGSGSGSYTDYCAYMIEGWDTGMSTDLLTRDLFFNGSGIQLWIYNLGQGNIISSRWDWIRNEQNCSIAIWLNVAQPQGGMTVGMMFENHREILYPYA
ncbi:MAG: hypothetical protein K6C12_04550 [Oscillospiraceae bacterium]|nr:hypothetical protein [Oscillospiraceae bacterium]